MQIWKFGLPQPGEIVTYEIKGPAAIAGLNPELGTVYCEVEPGGCPSKLTIEVVGTGWDRERKPGEKYLGSVNQGPYVWHAYAAIA